jgi:hypothetical protein
VITEPEMADEPGPVQPPDVLSSGDHLPGAPAAGGVAGRRPWLWALTAVVATSAVWTAVLQSTDYGHTAVPDLHGYHLVGNPCGGDNLKPLTDAMHTRNPTPNNPETRDGPALDEGTCSLIAEAPATGGWVTTYTVNVSVELHKKTDPRVEFEDRNRPDIARLTGPLAEPGTSVSGAEAATTVEHVPGLGDSAYYLLALGSTDQALKVLHGGAIFSLSLSGYVVWQGHGEPPDSPGTGQRANLMPLRPALEPAMRRLMKDLSS